LLPKLLKNRWFAIVGRSETSDKRGAGYGYRHERKETHLAPPECAAR
jgi:hypothetical protein